MKLAQLAQLVFVVLALIGVYSFVRAAQNDHRSSSCQALCQLRPTYAGRNRTVPDFELVDTRGKPVKMSSLLGRKPVVLNFWTKTCKPCLEEMPKLAEMAKILAEDGVQVVSVCTDEGGYDSVRDTLKTVLMGEVPPFTLLFDPDAKVIAKKFGTTMYPETWLIDSSGIIRARVDGDPGRYGVPWTSAMVLEVIENISRPGSCPVDFKQGRPIGRYAGLCDEG